MVVWFVQDNLQSCNTENGTVQEYGFLKSAWTNKCVLPETKLHIYVVIIFMTCKHRAGKITLYVSNKMTWTISQLYNKTYKTTYYIIGKLTNIYIYIHNCAQYW